MTDYRLFIAAVCAAALLALPASAQGGDQVVSGVVQSQFGGAIAADGSIVGNASTIPATVKREQRDGVTIVTITPLR